MQLTTKLSLVLCALVVVRPIAAAPTATDSTNEALSPRSGVNNGLDLGDILGGAGLFGGVKQGNNYGNGINRGNTLGNKGGNYGNGIGNGVGNKGGQGIGYGKGKGGKKFFAAKKLKAAKAANADKHKDAAAVNAATHVNAAAANEDANFNNAKLLKAKKFKSKGSGKGGFGGFDRRSGLGLGFNKKVKAAKLAKHVENANKHKAAAKVNAATKVKAAAAHEDSHFDSLAAKKLAAAKKKSGFGTFI
ncbi:hypothetical protein CF327_g5705 [Tilletia walkeri]|uniref:Uncharacterized protein n=1 Tax=Tilletia walkeri TaxID=117179 RepID=A0A8X7N5H3_9BASI|nr:hypothetical protein CF327_g5705 [Tilletia walkeri]KAE8267511.1 hypothetical protein A4X09_0g4828 [Tilletia walkeri]